MEIKESCHQTYRSFFSNPVKDLPVKLVCVIKTCLIEKKKKLNNKTTTIKKKERKGKINAIVFKSNQIYSNTKIALSYLQDNVAICFIKLSIKYYA